MKIVLNEMHQIRDAFKVILVAWCTDASGESAKMRRDLLVKFPWLVVLDCWAHQINLVVGDVIKVKVPLIRAADMALELIKWFNNHSVALGLLRHEQTTFQLVVLVLVLPVLTRWTSHYLAMDRLVELKAAFLHLVASEDICTQLETCGGPKAADKAKARKMIRLIRDNQFWIKVEGLRDLLHPFAIAANIIQADNCRLDTVLFALANLYRIHSTSTTIDRRICNAVIVSLDKRWKKADKDIFILAVIFNPYIRGKAFNPENELSTAGRLWHLVKTAFHRFSRGQEANADFKDSFTMYYRGVGRWSEEGMSLKGYRESAEQRGGFVHLVDLWRDFETEDQSSECGNGANGMVRLAMRILSMVPNSAPTEHVLSRFGAIHTKTRDRLHVQKVRKMTIVGQSIERKYGSTPRHSKQNSGTNEPNSTTPAPMASTTRNEEDDIERALCRLDLDSGDSDLEEPATQAPHTEGSDDDAVETVDGPDLLTFDEITQEFINEDDSSDTEDSEEQPDRVIPEASYLLKNLFRYPSPNSPQPTSLSFMTDFWARGEAAMNADMELH
ncbi:hypothetical protein K435DRAFT_910345, partial [Dendrothele bispora CBS 962.96]